MNGRKTSCCNVVSSSQSFSLALIYKLCFRRQTEMCGACSWSITRRTRSTHFRLSVWNARQLWINITERPLIWLDCENSQHTNIRKRFAVQSRTGNFLWNNHDFRPISLYLRNNTRYGHSYTGRRHNTGYRTLHTDIFISKVNARKSCSRLQLQLRPADLPLSLITS